MSNSSPAPTSNSAIRSRATRLGQSLRHSDDILLAILEPLVDAGNLGVLGLVCLGSCSKTYRSAAAALLQERATFLLLHA